MELKWWAKLNRLCSGRGSSVRGCHRRILLYILYGSLATTYIIQLLPSNHDWAPKEKITDAPCPVYKTATALPVFSARGQLRTQWNGTAHVRYSI
jgi:hypothetical protein